MSSTIFKKRETIYFTVFLIIFVVGVLIGSALADTSLKEEQLIFKQSQLDLQSFSIRFDNAEFFEEQRCTNTLLSELGEELYLTAKRLDDLERNNQIDNENYVFLKKTHNINQVLFYMKYKEFFEKCEEQRDNIILFFFNSSNEELSQRQGQQLDLIVENNREIRILPMDYGYTPQLSFFYDHYNFSSLPTLIINYEHTLEGLQNKETIEEYLLHGNQ